MLTSEIKSRLNMAASRLAGLKNNGSASWIDVTIASGDLTVTHPVCMIVGDQYFQLFTPLARGMTELDQFMYGSVVNKLNGSASQFKSWGLIPLPGSVLGLSLGVDYASPDLYATATLNSLVTEVARAASEVSADDELPGISRDLGLV